MRTFDEQYLQALARQDPQIESDLISFFTRPVTVSLRAHLRSPEAVEDARQETLLRVFAYFRCGKTLRTPGKLSGFVHSVCRNVALEIVRSQTRNQNIGDGLPDLIDQKADPEGNAIAAEQTKAVRQLLKELSDKDQQLLRRVCLEEEDKDTVCADFHVSRDYLRLLLYRARLRFRALVQ